MAVARPAVAEGALEVAEAVVELAEEPEQESSVGLKNGPRTSAAPNSVRTTTSAINVTTPAAGTRTIAQSCAMTAMFATLLPGLTSPRTAPSCD